MYSTADIDLASILVYKGFRPTDVKPPEGNRFSSFIFEETPELLALERAYLLRDPISVDNLQQFLVQRRHCISWAKEVAAGGRV